MSNTELFITNTDKISYDSYRNWCLLKKVSFDDSVKVIQSGAFENCVSLRNISVPNTRDLCIETGVFTNCVFEEVDWNGRTDFSMIQDNTLLIWGRRCPFCKEPITLTNKGFSCSKCGDYPWHFIDDFDKMYLAGNTLKRFIGYGYLQIPPGVTKIAPGAFDDSLATEVTIPDTVTEIGNRAFFWCDKMTTVSLSHSLERIEQLAFAGSALFSVSIPDSVRYIGNSAFASCTALDTVYGAENVTVIAEDAFSFCTSLNDINLPAGLKYIGPSAFADCKNLSKIKIPGSVSVLDSYCFAGCISLNQLTLSRGLLSIGEHAFKDCGNLTEIVVPDSVLSIGSGAFKGCVKLKKVFLPDTLSNIDTTQIFDKDVKITFVKSSFKK